MTRRAEDETPRPLPREWLPEPAPLEGTAEWRSMAERIIAAVEPKLRAVGARAPAVATTWSAILGSWWRRAAVLAAASAALLLVVGRPAVSPEPPPGAIALGLVASEADPVTLWGALGVQADPVLALIAIGGQADPTGPGEPSTIREEERR